MAGLGWTILAAALTNTPRAAQKDNPISIVERGEIITFGQDEFDQMLKNHTDRVWDFPPYIREGHYDNPALAWFARVDNEDPAGEMVQENDWLVAYALPTDEEVQKAKRGYRYASIDVHPDYSSNQMGLAFSSMEFEEIDEDEVTEEEAMVDDKDKKNVTLSAEEYKKLLDQESDRVALAKELEEVKAMKLALEAERVKTRKQLFIASVNGVIDQAKARRSEDGKSALPAFVLNTAESILKFEAIEGNNGVIKLDREAGESGVIDYVFNAVSYLLTNMPIISMAVEGSTDADETDRYDDGEKPMITLGLDKVPLDEYLENEALLSHGPAATEVAQ
jgi:hypothetical protein